MKNVYDFKKLCLSMFSGFLLSGSLFLSVADFYVSAALDFAPGSIRAAIIAANANRENDTIFLSAGTSGACIPTTRKSPRPTGII